VQLGVHAFGQPGVAGGVGGEAAAGQPDGEQEAAQAGPSFVEIQNTMLFATVGQRAANP